MLLSVVLTCAVALGLSTALLLVAGHRLRFASRGLSSVFVFGAALVAGELAGRLFDLPSRYVVIGELLVAASGVVVVLARPDWNPPGHVFLASLMAASLSYLAFAGYVTVAGGLSLLGVVASVLLWLLEAGALVIAGSFAFESCDVVCRVRWTRPAPHHDPAYLPRVCLQVAAYNEPPEMLIETIQSLEALDYPNLEIVVIDNNTRDEDVWRPVEAYCAGRERVRFVHVAPWPGFKSGALNLALRQYTSPDAEIVGVVDADYIVRSDYLRRNVGYFADPTLAFLQTPQDYREYEGDTYLTACYDAYKYFFETAMPSRNERNSIIFGGTMGLIRRSALEELGGWDEWCITEDAEASLRMLRAGHSGLYINESFGRGIMPLTFTALKRQRFRWCFGGIQILRKHWRSLRPWDRDPNNHLTRAQRLDYLFGGLQWFVDLIGVCFTGVLAVSGALLLKNGSVGLRPLVGAAVLLPAALASSGFLRALWALRQRTGISTKRAVLAFANWLGLSWTTALACVQGLIRSEGVFLRTPKWHSGPRLVEALRETRTETTLAVGAWGLGAVVMATHPSPALIGIFAWQGTVYACSPFMAWLNHRTELSARLARRQRSEERRDRLTALAPRAALAGVGTGALALVAFLSVAGGTQPSTRQAQLFETPRRADGDSSPLANLGVLPAPAPAASPTPSTTSTTLQRSGTTTHPVSPPTTSPAAPGSSPSSSSTTSTPDPGPTPNSPPTSPKSSSTTSTTATSSSTTTARPSPTTPSTSAGPPTSVSPPTSGPGRP